tara:strand:+ start:663 stop:851 length:189 start_codon:yes stop_codon:yes gene_type:complete
MKFYTTRRMLTMSDEMKVTEKFLKIMQETGIAEKWQFISSHETETEVVIKLKRKTTHDLEDK